MRVLLLSMPFGALDRPSLGLGLLQAGLRRAGVECDSGYPSITFGEFTGLQDYSWASGGLPHTAFAGEWLWTQALAVHTPARTELAPARTRLAVV